MWVINPALVQTLMDAQRLGMLGARPIEEVIAHSRVYVTALIGIKGRVVDLGSGGGVPGFVIAEERPDLELWMVERRGARADFLRRMVKRMQMDDRVTVHEVDAHEVVKHSGGSFSAVTARGFGPPEPTLRIAGSLISSEGRIVISDPPEGNRWSEHLLVELGLQRTVEFEDHGRVSVFHVKHMPDERNG